MMQLVRAMAGLADSVAEFRTVQHRLHQAATARQAAADLAAYQQRQLATVALPVDLPLTLAVSPAAPNLEVAGVLPCRPAVRHLEPPIGHILVQMLCAFAQFERELIIDRVNAGMERKDTNCSTARATDGAFTPPRTASPRRPRHQALRVHGWTDALCRCALFQPI